MTTTDDNAIEFGSRDDLDCWRVAKEREGAEERQKGLVDRYGSGCVWILNEEGVEVKTTDSLEDDGGKKGARVCR